METESSPAPSRCYHFLRKAVPSFVCVVLFLLQAIVLDYIVIKRVSVQYAGWLVSDFINLVLLMSITINPCLKICIHNKHRFKMVDNLSWLAWLTISLNVSIKVIFIVERKENMELMKNSFYSSNTFKTAVALGSCIYPLLLYTQHDAPRCSPEWKYIDDLTDTVVFDILDTADILDVFFDMEDRSLLWDGLEEIILAQSVLNLVLPTVPLLTLCCTGFGKTRISKHLVYIHRLLVVLVVNVPNLVTRFVLWHGVNVGISPFVLKNIILICIFLSKCCDEADDDCNDVEITSGTQTDNVLRPGTSIP
ncbi:uncharacterized protein LOC131947953 [Physella acuta]|uniref:uncharacterized protein LOC131947953 n=1 Tax=Physella acuta TaxID=109671 RepID=UPI0027DCA751|nr:uncharacterized protein LOC131947953 [Physella acuta]